MIYESTPKFRETRRMEGAATAGSRPDRQKKQGCLKRGARDLLIKPQPQSVASKQRKRRRKVLEAGD